MNLLRDVVVSPDGDFIYTADAIDNAIGVFQKDAVTGTLTSVEVVVNELGSVEGLGFVTSLVISSDGLFLYAAGTNDNAIALFGRDLVTGMLTFIDVYRDSDESNSSMAGPTHLMISDDQQHLYVAAADDKALSWFSREPLTGELTYQNTLLDNTVRSDGLDGVFSIAQSSDGKFLYLAASFDDSLTVYARGEDSGNLSLVEILQDNIDGIDGLDGAYQVIVSPNDEFVYVSSLADHSLLTLSRDSNSGRLTPVALYRDGSGDFHHLASPRSLSVTNDGRQLLLGASADDAITIIDTQNSIYQMELNNAQQVNSVDFGFQKEAAVWDGGGQDNLWSNPQNWAGDVLPEAGDRLSFAGENQLEMENDFRYSYDLCRH